MRTISRRTLLAAASLAALASCSTPPPRTDAAIIEMLRNDQAGFDQAARTIIMEPPIREFRVTDGASEVEPAGIPAERRQWLTGFLRSHDVSGIQHYHGRVSFIVSASGLGVSGQQKTLIFETARRITGIDADTLVPDTDAAVAVDPTRSTLAYRDLGDGWFIRNST